MSDTEDARTHLLVTLGKDIQTYVISYKRWQAIQWAFTVIMAAAGALTSAAGIKGATSWFGTPTALVIWGIVSAVTASLNQATNPAARSQRIHQSKFALHLTKGALEVGRIKVDEAERFWGIALTEPDKAIEELNRSVK